MAGPIIVIPDKKERESATNVPEGTIDTTDVPRETSEVPVVNGEVHSGPILGGDPVSREGAEKPLNVTPTKEPALKEVKPPRKVGRPSKKALAAKKPGGRGQVGRPKGDAAIMNEYKARMLASPKSSKVIAKVFDTALEDGHKHQAACMKMVMDRIAPLGAFEKDGRGGKAAGGINITITGVGATSIDGTPTDDIEDGEWEPVDT